MTDQSADHRAGVLQHWEPAKERTLGLEHRGHRGYTEGTEESRSVLPELSGRIIGCALRVHSKLGPGLLESAYEACLCREFSLNGMRFARQVEMPLDYEGLHLDCGYRLDLLVDNQAIVEIKALPAIASIHRAQLLTYLRLSKVRLGLLINFNVNHLRHGLDAHGSLAAFRLSSVSSVYPLCPLC